jgi:uncharacterized protein YjbI with pentapeptide repeats
MRWLKSEMWKGSIVIAVILIFLILTLWIHISAAHADERAFGLEVPGTNTVQMTPTEDATVTALNKEKLAQEVEQLKNQNQLDLFAWLRTNASIFFSTLAVVLGGLFGLWRWSVDRRDAQNKELEAQSEAQNKELIDRKTEREKRAEERFQSVVEGLGSERNEAKVGAAIMLRTFLQPDYQQFYQQSFDLAVAHLRLREVNPNKPIDSLSQALIRVFTESTELVREEREKFDHPEYAKYLDAAHIRLDGAYIARTRLQKVWFREAHFAGANLHSTKLQEADLIKADLSKADLDKADLSKAKLRIAKLSGAILTKVNLEGVDLYGADLSGANLEQADLTGANLEKTKPETAESLKETMMRGVRGLTREQLVACKAKGAIIDEDSLAPSS